MTSRATFTTLLIALFAGLLVWSGCTRESSLTVSQPAAQIKGASNSYFPVATGKTSTFVVSNYGGGTSMLTIKMGSKIPFGTDSAWQWFAVRPDNSVDTDYVVVTSSTVVLYEDKNAAPETILRSPLLAGQSWARFPVSTVLDSVQVDTTTLATGVDGGIVIKAGNGGDPGNGNGTGKVVPITGGAQARIDGFEEVVLSNGDHYSDALKVSTQNSAGTTNSYWFAPAYGLVKYVLGATPTRPTGAQLGELVN